MDILEQAANEGFLDYAIIDNVLRPEDYWKAILFLNTENAYCNNKLSHQINFKESKNASAHFLPKKTRLLNMESVLNHNDLVSTFNARMQ